MTLDFSRCRPVPLMDGSLSFIKEHVKVGVTEIVKSVEPESGRIYPNCFALFDEMGAMKTAQAIISAQFLFEKKEIDNVVVLAPASVRSVWFDEETGELQKHLFEGSSHKINEYHARTREWWFGKPTQHQYLHWVISNYEFIRSANRLETLFGFVTKKTFLICDESSAVKNHRAIQTINTLKLRNKCGRVLLLNGTPIAHSPMDMFSQGQIMDPRILGLKSYFFFRSKYAIMGGWQQKQVIGWQNIEDLQARFKPYVLRRLTKDCLDLPPVLPTVTLTVPLSEGTWQIYKSMRDEMVSWLSDTSVCVVQQAAVKAMRLAQITSGFLGGVVEDAIEDPVEEGFLESLDLPGVTPTFAEMPWRDTIEAAPKRIVAPVQAVGREKLDFVLGWHKDRLIEEPDLKLLTWCRFIPELGRYLKEVQPLTKHVGCVAGQSLLGKPLKIERSEALRLLNPNTAPPESVTVGGTYGTGSLGINLTACHTVVNMSYDYSYWKKLQGDKRVDRPGQLYPVRSFDIVAVGPKGQKTIDHDIVKVRRGHEDIANRTSSAWISALTEE